MSASLMSSTLPAGLGQKPAPGAVFDLGVSRLFGHGDLGDEGMVSGWAVPEDNHNWNDGIEASFVLAVKAGGGVLELVVEGVPLTGETCPSQDITLYANGFRVGFWCLNEGGPQRLTARIEPEQVFWRGKLGYIKCVWVMPNSVRLSEIRDSTDTRQLAFCFRSILLRDVP